MENERVCNRHGREHIAGRAIRGANRAADRLNVEAEETLQYQADPWRPEME